MKAKHFLLSICTVLLHYTFNSFGQSTDYVHLKNKKFVYENGDDFYPMLVNYSVEITSPDNGVTWGIAPYGGYGINSDFACGPAFSDCPAAILRDLQHISDMGFNGIRLWMSPIKEHDTNAPFHSHPGFIYGAQCYPSGCSVSINLSAPYIADANTQMFFSKVDEVLALCEQVTPTPLKVKLVCAIGQFANDVDVINDYSEYLTAIGYYFTNISIHGKVIMAYDLWNEPGFVNDPAEHYKKDICEIVDKWCSSIRVYDKNHLITMGTNSFNDVFEWDKAVMPLDFASEHIYPFFLEYENFDYVKGMERFRDELIWTKNNCPIPWMIGETTFRASNSTDAAHNMPPYVAGAETDPGNLHGQDDAMEFMLNAVRDAGGAGFSWWQFGDVHWGADDPDKWVGLVRLEEPNPGYASITKPCVSKVLAFDPWNTQTLAAPTSSYNNPLNHPDRPMKITGHVQDQNGDPIKDAIVRGWTYTHTKFNQVTQLDEDQYDLHYVLTDANGDFEIRPFDFVGIVERVEVISAINVSAYGCDRYYANWGPSTLNVFIDGFISNQPSTFNTPTVLKRINFQYDGVIQNVTINNGDYQKFRGYNSLTVSESTIESGGAADLTAHNEVNIEHEFFAKSGSETHIYISLGDCDNTLLNSFNRKSSPAVNNIKSENKSIEINFKKKINYLEIYPNPNNGKFTVSIYFDQLNNNRIEVFDLEGRILYVKAEDSDSFEIDLSDLSKGIYLLRATLINQIFTQKIIIN